MKHVILEALDSNRFSLDICNPTEIMPVEGLPVILEKLMESLLGNSGIQGWQIYPEKFGNICMKIRFSNVNMSTHDQTHAYRRKSPSQTRRDKHRADTWSTRPLLPATSDDPPPPMGVKTRHMVAVERRQAEEPEQPRSAVTESCHQTVFSPEAIQEASPPDFALRSEASTFVPTLIPRDTLETTSPASVSLPPAECSLTSVPSLPSHPSSSSSSSLSMSQEAFDSDVDTDVETMSREIGTCGCSDCAYGGGGHYADDSCTAHFVCQQCSTPGSRLIVCSHCRDHGGHQRHSKYMTFK